MLVKRNFNIQALFLLAVGCWAIYGCATEPKPYRLDSPEYRVRSGFRLLKLNRAEDAEREFKKAISTRSCYSSALRGLGISCAYQGKFHVAKEAMSKALACAETGQEKALAHVGFMRILTMEREGTWLREVLGHFRDALELSDNLSEAYYYLGVAYRTDLRLSKAEWAFKKVIELSSRMTEEAEAALIQLEKIRQAMPITQLGRQISIRPVITRAEVAAILIHELKLDKILARYGAIEDGRGYSPVKIPQDVISHKFRQEIIKCLGFEIKALTVSKEGEFNPEDIVTRAQYAVMISDVIEKITRDQYLKDSFKKTRSPFSDIEKHDPYFGAVMVCTQWRGIIESNCPEFNPMDPITGADALLAIRRLKDELRIYDD